MAFNMYIAIQSYAKKCQVKIQSDFFFLHAPIHMNLGITNELLITLFIKTNPELRGYFKRDSKS